MIKMKSWVYGLVVGLIFIGVVFLLWPQLQSSEENPTPPSTIIATTETRDPTFVYHEEWLKEIYTSTEKITDGVLDLSITSTTDECYAPGERFIIEYTFKNTSDRLIMVDDSGVEAPGMMSGSGNMLPIYFDSDYDNLLRASDLVDMGWDTDSRIIGHIELQPGDEYSGDVELTIPMTFFLSYESENPYATPKPGIYYVKVVFREVREFSDMRRGLISSNLVKVCIVGE